MTQNETVTNRAVLTFLAQEGRKGSFSVPRANTTKSALAAVASMEAMVLSGALDFGAIGSATAPYGAKIVNTVRTRIV